jgi:hypothetical protein
MNAPSLVDPARQQHVSKLLKKCRAYKDDMISLAVNVGLLVLFLGAGWAVLSYKANNRADPPTQEETERLRRDIVLQAMGRPTDTWSGAAGSISGLPGFSPVVGAVIAR